ncbi:hypothetical protein DL771_001175 [Monosporascus sp. 5C6A]|nr:hypothetical protein DL771_001175 [Monosporascus sp. 5C6A]
MRTGLERGKIRAQLREQQHKSGRASGIPTCDLLVYGGGSDAEKSRHSVFSTSGLLAKSEVRELGTRPSYDDSSNAAIFEQPAWPRIGGTGCLDTVRFADACPRDGDLDCPPWVAYCLNHTAAGNDHMVSQTFPSSEQREALPNKVWQSEPHVLISQQEYLGHTEVIGVVMADAELEQSSELQRAPSERRLNPTQESSSNTGDQPIS